MKNLFFLIFIPLIIAYLLLPSYSEEKSQKKILVVYYSRTGNTKRVAEDIAKKLNADIEQIVDKKNRSGFSGAFTAGKDATFKNETEIDNMKYNPSEYDLIIIGTPVWAWDITPAVRTYVAKYKSSFKSVSFFNTSGNTGIEKITPILEEITGKKAVSTVGFNEKELKQENNDQYLKKIDEFTKSTLEKMR